MNTVVSRKIFIMVSLSLVFLTVFFGGCSVNDPQNAAAATLDSILWVNGTYAVITKINNDDITEFGGMAHNSLNKQIVLNTLEESWGVTTKAELDEMIDSLAVGRHNPMFLEEIEEYGIMGMSESEFGEAMQNVTDRMDAIFFQNMFDAYQEFGENAIFGWDLSRAAQLCAYGYIADFYTYEEGTNRAFEVGGIIQNTFDSWDSFFASYLYGYEYWSEDDIDDANSEYNERVRILDALKKDESSPLHLDWHLDLSKSLEN